MSASLAERGSGSARHVGKCFKFAAAKQGIRPAQVARPNRWPYHLHEPSNTPVYREVLELVIVW